MGVAMVQINKKKNINLTLLRLSGPDFVTSRHQQKAFPANLQRQQRKGTLKTKVVIKESLQWILE